MNRLPLEIILEVACILPVFNLCNLRFVNRYIAYSVSSIFFRNLSVLNTAEYIKDLLMGHRAHRVELKR